MEQINRGQPMNEIGKSSQNSTVTSVWQKENRIDYDRALKQNMKMKDRL